MAIVRMSKVTLYGTTRQRDEVLDGLQRLGCLHLIDLSRAPGGRTMEPVERHEVQDAIRYLLACPVQNANQRTRYPADTNCMTVARQALANQRHRDELSDERDHLQRAIQLDEPWGEFRLPDPDDTAGNRLWFYPVRRRQLHLIRESNLPWTAVNEDRQFIYVVVVSKVEPDLPIAQVFPDPRPMSELCERLETVSEELEALHWQRVMLTRWLMLMQKDMDRADDEMARQEALTRLACDASVFAVQGWAPQRTIDALRAFAHQHTLALTIAPPERGELPPTLFKNPEAVAGAEGIMTFYITPSYRAWDPTWILHASFSFFFAMIMSDAAYGLLMGLALAFAWRKLGQTPKLQRLRNLFLTLVIATIVYGALAGSWFGTTPASVAWMQVQLDGAPLAANRDAMMILSLLIGVFHLTLANLITAWRDRHSPQALRSLGWALALLGGLTVGLFHQATSKSVFFLAALTGAEPADFQPLARQAGLGMLIAGLAMILLFTSSRPLVSARPVDWLMRFVDGLMGLTRVTSAFGDALSYLRLFALGLATGQLAVTFNNLAAGVSEVQGLGFLLAGLILLVGHSINIVLGIMSGVVHGLRLNCIEFFNWSLTDEGYPFRAFCKKAG